MPRIRSLIIIVTLLFCSSTIYASGKSKKTYRNTKEAMNEIFQSFINLLPYAANEMKFKDPKSEKYILGNLTRISQAFKNSKHLRDLKSPGFAPSYNVVNDHLNHTLEAFSTKNKLFARTRLRATANICMSCHTQLSGNRKLSSSFKAINNVTRGDFESDYEFADFLFLVRNYNKAIRYFEKEIVNRIKKNQSLKKIHNSNDAHYIDFTIDKSIKKILTIYTKIYFKPEKARSVLTKYITYNGVPKKLQSDLKDWLKDLEGWEKQGFKGRIKNEKELKGFISKHLSPIEKGSVGDGTFDIDLMVASGALYRFLNARPKTESTSEILYWLAVVDYRLNHSYFYSLGDIYLKQCITQFKSKKCFDQYEDHIKFGYTGSAGVNIPPEEKKELSRLKALLK